jgi:hypothetical protein
LAASSISPGPSFQFEVALSTDDVHWTVHRAPIHLYAYGLVWDAANAQWVAVGDSGTGTNVGTSPDGVTWTSQTQTGSLLPSLAPYLSSVAAHAGRLVAGSYDLNNPIWLSTDAGVTWNPVTTPSSILSPNVYNVHYLNGRFVAVGSQVQPVVGSVGMVMHSVDGFTWLDDAGSSILVDSIRDIAWSPALGLYVAVGRNAGHAGPPFNYRRVFTSHDLATWTPQSMTSPLGPTPDFGSNGQRGFLNGIAWNPTFATFAAAGILFWLGLFPTGAGAPLRQRQRNDGLTVGASRVRAGVNTPTSVQLGQRIHGNNGYI